MSEEKVIRHLASDGSIYVHAPGENCDFEGGCAEHHVPEPAAEETPSA